MRIFFLLISVSVLILAGCAKTTVVLLPDSAGKVGQVDVTTDAGTQTLDQENEYTSVSSSGSKPAEPKSMAQAEIDDVFKNAMEILPEKPVSFLLYFKFDSDDLTDDSKKLIPEVISSIRKREPSEVSVIGHTDTMGSDDYNVKLSLSRAEGVRKLLCSYGINISKMEVSSHGEHDPIIKTPDNVSEPRNRRVEVMVR